MNDPDVPTTPATGNDAVYFRYFDATEQASFLYDALERTVEHNLDEEISYLLGFDRACGALTAVADWPAHSVERAFTPEIEAEDIVVAQVSTAT